MEAKLFLIWSPALLSKSEAEFLVLLLTNLYCIKLSVLLGCKVRNQKKHFKMLLVTIRNPDPDPPTEEP